MTEEVQMNLTNVAEENEKLKLELNNKQSEIISLTSRLKETEEHINKLASEKNALIGDKADVDQDTFNHITKLKEVIGIKDKRIEKLERDLELLREDNARLQEKLNKENLLNPGSSSSDSISIQKLENELAQQKIELEAAKVSTEELLTKYHELEKRNEELTKENMNLQNDSLILKQQLQESFKSIIDKNESKDVAVKQNAEPPAPSPEDISELKKKILLLEEANKLLSSQLDENAEEKEKFRLATEKLAEIEAALQLKNTELQKKMNESAHELAQYQSLISTKDVTIEEKSQEIANLMVSIEEKNKEIIFLKAENEKLTQILQESQAQSEQLNTDFDLLTSQYKEQQGTLKEKLEKLEELRKLLTRAVEDAEKHKQESKEKDKQIVILAKKVDEKKRQLAAAQAKIKSLTGSVIAEMTKQLELKVKEVEILKEMLRSAKIEVAGKEREIRRMKKTATSQSIKLPIPDKAIKRTYIQSLSANRSNAGVKDKKVVDNSLLKSIKPDLSDISELANLKNLSINPEEGEIQFVDSDLSPELPPSPKLTLPPISNFSHY